MGTPIRREQMVISPGSTSAGEPGESAYDIAVRNGFVGTEAQWLLSLKGSSEGQMPEGILTEEQKGAPGGIPTLDETAKIPVEQMRMALETADAFDVVDAELVDHANQIVTLSDVVDTKQPAGSYLTGITGPMVTTALGFTPQAAGTYATGGGTATGDNTGDQFKAVNAGFIGRDEAGFGPAGYLSATSATALLDSVTTATKGLMLAADKVKINGIATGATANSADATLLSRSNHTGTQSLDTTTDSATRLALTTAERTKLTGIATGATVNASDAQLRDRTTHTGSQAISTITGLQTALDGKQASGSYLTANQTITLSGDVTGSGATAITVTLATVNSNVGTFGNSTTVPVITVNGKGLVTAVTTAAISASGGGQPLPTIYRLTANHSNSTVTPSTITDGTTPWTHTLVAGKTYRFSVFGGYQSAALTTGGRMNLLGAGGLAGTVAGMMWGGIAQAAAATTLEVPIYSFANAAGSFLLTTAVNPINSPHIWGADFVFHCTTGGTLSLQWASEVAASAAQLNAGSVLMVELLN